MRILIIDNDKNVRKVYRTIIMEAGFSELCVDSADNALTMLGKEHFDMIVMDTALTGMSGITFIHLLRDSGNMLPILITSEQRSHKDIDAGLLAGADDYMIKPVENEEFLLRIKAILRRSRVSLRNVITVGSTIVDSYTRIVTVGSERYSIPHKEFDLLFFLLSYPNQVFSREYLMNEIWGPDSDSELATVNVHINRIRKHFADNKDFTIKTCRCSGFKACTTLEQ